MSSRISKGKMIAALLALGINIGSAHAEWQANPDDERQVKAAKALGEFKDRIPGTDFFLDNAYGFAILPSIGRIAVGFGGSYGRGIVVEGDEMIGTTSLWQFSSGVQAGGKFFSMIIFFKDKEALDYYKTGKIQFLGDASVALATVGVQSTPSYNEGVAILSVNRFGLLAEFAASGAKFRYKPISEE